MQGKYKPTRPVFVPIGPSIAYVPLTKGQHALIAVHDVPKLDDRNWCASWNSHGRCYTAVRRHKGVMKLLHRHIFSGNLCDGETVDHIIPRWNLNCPPHNLRAANQTQQNANQHRKTSNASGYKGVNRHLDQWRAKIQMDGKSIHLGLFDSPAKAHEAYVEAARKHFGDFARTE